MKITIEQKDHQFIVTYGKSSGTGKNLKDALEAMIASFRAEVEQFFLLVK